MSAILAVILCVIVIGAILYFVQQAPLAEPWRSIAILLIILVAVLMLFSYLPGGHGIALN